MREPTTLAEQSAPNSDPYQTPHVIEAPNQPQSLASQNRPLQGVRIERIDPSTLELISFLFPCQVEGIQFLALLCRRATEKQFAMFEQNMAVITFHGIATLCQAPDWKWGYHATLRYFVIFEALGVLTRLRRNSITEVHIPLGIRGEPLSREQLLKSLGDLQKNTPKKKREYKDKKLVHLIERVKKHIEVYGLGTSGDSEYEQRHQFDQAPLLTMQERLIEAMRSERIPLAKCKRIAQWVSTNQVPQLLRDYLLTGEQLPEHQGDSEMYTHQTGRFQCNLSDSKRDDGATDTQQQGDSQDAMGDSQNGHVSLQQRADPAQITQNRPLNQKHDFHSDISRLAEQEKSPVVAPGATSPDEEGDSEQCLSSNISLFCNKFSKKDRNDIEKAPEAVSSESPRLERESILAEATWIAVELDGEESLKFNRGKGWIGAYKKKLEENPYLVRVSMIDMFMQRSFPDWQGMPQGRGGKWFNRVYKEYALEQKPVPAEIESWARSGYGYQQIKEALSKERQRQDREIASHEQQFSYANPLQRTRPLAACVELLSQHGEPSQDEVSHACDVQMPEEDQEEGVEMDDGSILSREAFEQLQIRALGGEHLGRLLLEVSEEADEALSRYVQRWVTETISFLPPEMEDDLQRVKEIVSPLYVADVCLTSTCYAICVQARGNPANFRLLETTEQTEAFLDLLAQVPDDIRACASQLEDALDPETFSVELWLPTLENAVVLVCMMDNPNNACFLDGLAQTQSFLDWVDHLPESVLDDMAQVQAMLNPAFCVTELLLSGALAGRFLLAIRAKHQKEIIGCLEGADQIQAFLAQAQERRTEKAD